MLDNKVIDNRKKNTKRKITKEAKAIVWKRDKWKCIICHCDTVDEFHHARFWWDAIYTEDRNDPKELVLLCHSCHNRLHFEWSSNWMRQECIIYLNRIYGKIQS